MFTNESAFPQLLLVVRMFLRSLDVICYNRWVISDGCKNYFKDWCLVILQLTFLFLTYLNLKITSISSNPYHLIQASTPPPQNFFSFGPWLDILKLERNPKFQVLGSSGTLLFQLFRIGPLDQKMTATMQKWGLPYVSWFQFLRDVFSQ